MSLSSKNFKSSLILKVALLLATPLLFNVVWMSLFWNGVIEQSKLLSEEQDERRLLLELNRMLSAYYEGCDNAVMWAIRGTLYWEKKSLTNLDAFHLHYQQLRENPGLSDEQKKALDEANDFLQNSFKVAAERSNIKSKTLAYLDLKLSPKHLNEQIVGRDFFLESLFKPEEKKLESLESKNKRAQEVLLTTAISGLVVNIAGTIIFALFFMRNFQKRLQMLVLHAEQLGSRTAIESAVIGNDELAVVDNAMRNSATQLENVFSFKRMLTEMMAHDLRSPLASALVSLERILDTPGDSSETKKQRLQTVQSSVLRSAALVDDMLILDSLETGNMTLSKKQTDIFTIVKDSADILQGNAAARGVSLTLNCEHRKINVDPKRIGQVLTNLITNAIKFSPENSEIIVEHKEEPGELKISVRDFGSGVKADEVEKIFEKYYRSDKHKEVVGTGLGLAICKMIVEAHGGRIGCMSNNGAIFWFTIPT